MTTIGRYELVGELGRGGWGVVYRAIDPGLGRTVAIKTIRANNDDKEIRERFHREARTAGMLSHPNIVTVYEFSDTGDVMFIAMEYIDGQTLAQRMGEGPLPVEFTLAMARAASEALDFAHAHNIVHRDVKPGNFMISKDGRLKMADFGIAKILDAEVGLTSTGIVIGTAQYMSPEQIAAKEVTGRSDQFSLAVIAYEMLTGHRPFQGNSWASIMHAIISTEPPPLSDYRKELGDEATQVLRRGLAKDPQQRYPSCKSLVDALDHALLGPTAERPSYWSITGKIPLDSPTESMTAAPARPKTSSHTQRPVSEETETMYVPPPSATARPSSSLPAESTPATEVLPSPSGSSTAARMRRQWVVLASVAALVVLGVGSWFLFLRNHQNAPQTPAISASGNTGPIPQPSGAHSSEPVTQPASVPESAAQTPGSNASVNVDPIPQSSATNTSHPSPLPASAPAVAVTTAPRAAESAQRDSAKSSRAKIAKADPASATAFPSPSANITNPPPLAPPSAASAPSVPLNPPAPIAAPAPKRAEEDQARRAAEEQARRAAEEQAKRTAEEQARRAAEEQAKRTADEQAKRIAEEQAKTAQEEKLRSAHAAELQSVARTLANYKSAYENKDAAALQEIWPSLSKTSLDDIRRSFRDASDVKIDIHAVGDPEIAGDTATVVCDRNLRQVIRKKTFQASGRVRIALNRQGKGWVIASIDAVQ